jgi:membrane protein YdbS with pleckstrin-like domain
MNDKLPSGLSKEAFVRKFKRMCIGIAMGWTALMTVIAIAAGLWFESSWWLSLAWWVVFSLVGIVVGIFRYKRIVRKYR